MMLCVETALRYVASQYDAKLLYPSEWNTEKFLYYMENYQKQITESAGKNVLGRNLPQRAAWMIYLLNKSNNLSSSSFFIEIGAASGYILDALSKPNKFKEWIQDNHDVTESMFFNQELILPENTAGSFGVDLLPPNELWSLASLGDDEAIKKVQNFRNVFSKNVNIVKGNVLDENMWAVVQNKAIDASKNGQTPIIIASEMLYQIPIPGRQQVLEQIRSLTQSTDGLFLRSDGGQYMELPQYENYTVGELRNSQWQVIGKRLLLTDKYRLMAQDI